MWWYPDIDLYSGAATGPHLGSACEPDTQLVNAQPLLSALTSKLAGQLNCYIQKSNTQIVNQILSPNIPMYLLLCLSFKIYIILGVMMVLFTVCNKILQQSTLACLSHINCRNCRTVKNYKSTGYHHTATAPVYQRPVCLPTIPATN